MTDRDPALCRECEEKGEPFRCSVCDWQGRGAEVRTEPRDSHCFWCPRCNDDADMRCLEDMELTEAYEEECPFCPQDGDQHVFPFGRVPEAAGEQPEHDLRGTGCWCMPDVAYQPCGPENTENARMVIHRAVEVS